MPNSSTFTSVEGSPTAWPPPLDLPIEELRGIGARRGAALREAGVQALGDLLWRVPRRYLDRTLVARVAQAPVDQDVTLVVRVVGGRCIRQGRPRFVLAVEDDTGGLTCTWFHAGRYLERTFAPGDTVALSGRVEVFRGARQMVHPEYEWVVEAGAGEVLHTGRVIPLYASSADLKERGLRSRGFHRLVHAALQDFGPAVAETLPDSVRRRCGLLELRQALWAVHFPAELASAEQGRRRLAFDEIHALQRELLERRRQRRDRGIVLAASRQLVPRLLAGLPFTPTKAQLRAMDEIAADLGRPHAMGRLLQGDVGAGKTLVALAAMLTAVENGYQAALMAPTEVLAEQHLATVGRLVEPLGLRPVLLTGSQGAVSRRQATQAVESGAARLVVGTHALIEEAVRFARLGLAVVDEQHRFGVAQRAALHAKGQAAHLLVMTATPIPRTLAMTVYGDLDVSVIGELPPGRRPVRTAVRSPERRGAIHAFAALQVRQGRQVYVVYPLIEESEKSDLGSALQGYEELRQGPFSGLSVGLMHGRLRSEEKAAVMEGFKAGRVQVLVSTTVIEVGVDVPNATVMVVEHAERFGLAQLHQLRGRVGRGADQSYCILVAHEPAGAERLEVLCRTQDGFAIAEWDLRLRGPGELLGTRQAGLPPFRVADLGRDQDLLLLARQEATRVLAEEG
ncbi:MAG: ATP-dependent DNA helicase RecG, partial [Candidatus Latescibacterota bacterium]